MSRMLGVLALMLAITACGYETVGHTTAAAAGPDLSGVSLEVHQAPG